MRNGIPEFRPRQPLDRQLSSATLNDIRRELESLRIVQVVNGSFRKLPGGTEITVAPQRGGSAAASTRPFKVVTRQFEANGPWYWGVVSDSKLFLSLSPNDNGDNLAGLLGEDQADSDPNWLEITPPDYIYIEYDVEAVEAKIDSVGNGGAFDPDAAVNQAGAYIEVDTTVVPNEFKFARKIIATAQPPEETGGRPVVTQGITAHQLYQDIALGGYPVAYFFDYSGIGKIPAP